MELKSQGREAELFTTLVPMYYQYSKGAIADSTAVAAVKVTTPGLICSHLWCPLYLHKFEYTRSEAQSVAAALQSILCPSYSVRQSYTESCQSSEFAEQLSLQQRDADANSRSSMPEHISVTIMPCN